jgi:hypothetical protein
MPVEPIDSARDFLKRARGLLDASNTTGLSNIVKNDLKRSSLVYAVAALDTYLHQLVYKEISNVRSAGELPSSLARFEIPFGDIATLADAVVDNQRRTPKKRIRPWVKAKNALLQELLKDTFQNFDQVSRALSMTGMKRPWEAIGNSIGMTPDQIRERLRSITNRRNQIVHEGDFVRALRPRSIRRNLAKRDEFRADIDWIAKLIDAIETMRA